MEARNIRTVQGTRTLVEQIRAGTADNELSAIVVAVYDRQRAVVEANRSIRDRVLDAMYEEVGLVN